MLANPDIEKMLKQQGYQNIRYLAQGGFGEIYRADYQDVDRYRDVAIKVLKEKEKEKSTARERFIREVKILSTASHEGIVKILLPDLTHYYYVMPYLPGPSWHQLAGKEKRLFVLVSRYLELLDAVAYLHLQGTVHRDINPNNVRLDENGKSVLIDLGLAHASMSSLTGMGGTLGTPGYLPPEHLNGKDYSTQGEVWTLGMVFYKMLTGDNACEQNPILGTTTMQIKSKYLNDLPLGLGKTIETATSLDDKQRQTGAMGLLGEITDWLQRYRKSRANEYREKGLKFEESADWCQAKDSYEKSWLWDESESEQRQFLTGHLQTCWRGLKPPPSGMESRVVADSDWPTYQIKRKCSMLERVEVKDEEIPGKSKIYIACWKAEESSDGRYWISDQGIITDTTTNLEWLVGPDEDTTWYQADDWVKSLNSDKFAGRTWKMPRRYELLGIYENNKICGKSATFGWDIHLDPVFKTTGLWVWSGELYENNSSCAWLVGFGTGYAGWGARSNARGTRGFAVCAGRHG